MAAICDITVKDEQDPFVLVNRAIADWIGKDIDWLIGCTDDDVFDATSARTNRAENATVRNTGRPQKTEVHQRRHDGVDSIWMK